jgi:hypothetical protein
MNFRDKEMDKILYFLELVVSLSPLLHDPLMIKIFQPRDPHTEEEWDSAENGARHFEFLVKNGPFCYAFDANGTYHYGAGEQFVGELAKRERSKTINSLQVVMPLIFSFQYTKMADQDKELECINKRLFEDSEYGEREKVYIKAFKRERFKHSLLNGFFREMHDALQELVLTYKDFRDVTLYFRVWSCTSPTCYADEGAM